MTESNRIAVRTIDDYKALTTEEQHFLLRVVGSIVTITGIMGATTDKDVREEDQDVLMSLVEEIKQSPNNIDFEVSTEMHDYLAHEVGMIMMQALAARRVI